MLSYINLSKIPDHLQVQGYCIPSTRYSKMQKDAKFNFKFENYYF